MGDQSLGNGAGKPADPRIAAQFHLGRPCLSSEASIWFWQSRRRISRHRTALDHVSNSGRSGDPRHAGRRTGHPSRHTGGQGNAGLEREGDCNREASRTCEIAACTAPLASPRPTKARARHVPNDPPKPRSHNSAEKPRTERMKRTVPVLFILPSLLVLLAVALFPASFGI